MALPAGRRGVRPDQINPDGSIKTTPYELPVASASVLGGIKVGSGLSINDGVLAAVAPTPYELPTASDTVLGGVKVGNGLSINDGVLSVVAVLPAYDPTLDVGKVLGIGLDGNLTWVQITN